MGNKRQRTRRDKPGQTRKKRKLSTPIYQKSDWLKLNTDANDLCKLGPDNVTELMLNDFANSIDSWNDEYNLHHDYYSTQVWVPNRFPGTLKDLWEKVNKYLSNVLKQKNLEEQLKNQNLSRNDLNSSDGKCHIQFVKVGPGDCTTVRTPLGKKILIDLGSDSMSDVAYLTEDEERDLTDDQKSAKGKALVKSNITGNAFLDGGNIIDILLLTHPDADHHNRLAEVFGNDGLSGIQQIYFGGTESLSAYTSMSWLKDRTPEKKIKMIELSHEMFYTTAPIIQRKVAGVDINQNSAVGSSGETGKEWLGKDKSICLYRELDKDQNEIFKVSVIASNVKLHHQKVKDQDKWVPVFDEKYVKSYYEYCESSNENNRRSMVVVVEAFGDKVLVCGDATALTEAFMVQEFGTTLSEVNVVRIAHHGSKTSSWEGFVNKLTSATYAIASAAADKKNKHGHPCKEILDQFTSKSGSSLATVDAHNLYAYENQQNGSWNYFKNITKALYCTGSGVTQLATFKKKEGEEEPMEIEH